ncbi:fatty acyl-CoA reductase 2-like [Solanum tuberosum]|uniref:fatty acyl-CoA reductase 2-like n=1 Tax=Solanum tuberosum TaxID=4113 RepID=UPI0003D29AE2|nr:PREDICTED: fatty acyl-CoA reductase 2-like [Solanum tuberosum]
MHGESYKLFIQNKLVPVVGNIYEPNLGMDIITTQQIDLIVNSAAITTFDERYDLALDANVNAYANGEREGMILEKPFTMGESITKEKITSVSPFINFPSLYADNEIDLVSKLKNNVNNNGLEQLMKDLGVERAKLHGWQDAYSFTKAIGEMMINSMREEIPILILRPSIITSSYKEPFSGWIQGLRVLDSLIVFYRKGDLSGFLGDPNCHLDVVPVDKVVNATMAAIAKHGYLQNPELNVYHVTSTLLNPFTLSQFFDYCYEYFTSFPFINSKGDKVKIREMKYFNKMSNFENYIWEVLIKQHEVQDDLAQDEIIKLQKRFKKKVKYLKQFSLTMATYKS